LSQVFQTLFEEHEDILPNRWITLEEQKEWCDFLQNQNLPVHTVNMEKLAWCASEWEKYHCSVNHSHSNKVHYLNCGQRGVCPRCSMSYARKRASIMYKWIKDNIATRLDFDLKLNQIVLTLPKELHNMNQKLFAKMIKEFMSKFDIDSYGYSIQNRHSKDPLSSKYVHAHLLSLNMRKVDDEIIKSDYFFDLVHMRDVWKKIIQDNCKVVIEGDVNLHSEYASVLNEPYKVLHNFAYLYRYPIQDLFNVQVRNHSINYVQNDAIQKSVTDLINEKKPRIVWCGLLTSTKRKELIKTMLHQKTQTSIDNTILHFDQPNYHWKSMKEVEKEIDIRSKECHDCGSPFDPEPFDRGYYDGNNEPEVRE
jgi:hypothetical protein